MCYGWYDLKQAAERWGINFNRDFHKDYQPRVEAVYRKHIEAGFKYWDYEKCYPKYQAKGGWDAFRKIKDDPGAIKDFIQDVGSYLMRDEMWLQRGLDNAAVLKPDINIIEGIIGMDGMQHGVGGISKDYLCNIIIVGLSAFEVDAVGTYIMGHDPREIWYTRVAKERGLGECDVNKIDIYKIKDSEIIPVKDLTEIKRHPLGVNLHSWKETGKRLFW